MLYFPIEKGDVANAFNNLIYIVHLYVVQYQRYHSWCCSVYILHSNALQLASKNNIWILNIGTKIIDTIYFIVSNYNFLRNISMKRLMNWMNKDDILK